MVDTGRIQELLQLSPLVEKAITFEEFLLELREHPERADSAAALLFRAVSAMGVERADDEADPDRRLYLQMLSDVGIPSFNAFKHVAGSQRFAVQVMRFLRSAGAGGAQAQQMLVVDGPPGSGKDYFKDGLVAALEQYTDTNRIYAVGSCPHHENPINLLRLLSKTQLVELSQVLGMGDALLRMVAASPQPCQHCYQQVMGSSDKPDQPPSFANVQVVALRLSTRSAGVADWQPGATISLAQALDRANRGFVSLTDAFVERSVREGETDERLLLLDATQYHRLPPIVKEQGMTSSIPSDTVIFASTNKRAFATFLGNVVPDKNAFTSRTVMVTLPYNLVRSEEVRTYAAERERFKQQAQFDPLVLKLLATVAILSRIAKPSVSGKFVHPLDVVAIYEGKRFQPKLRPETEFAATWEEPPKQPAAPFAFGDYGNYGRNKQERTSAETIEERPAMPQDGPIDVNLLWQYADLDEGSVGLDMRFMRGVLSSLNEYGLASDDGCVSSLTVLSLLHNLIYKQSMMDNITREQKLAFDRLVKWFGGVPAPVFVPANRPSIIESEYRRMLRELLLQVFAPDYHERADKLFREYRLHAPAAFEGVPTVKSPTLGMVPVNTLLVDELDRYRVGKAKGTTLSETDKQFRGQLDTLIGVLREEHMEKPGASADSFKLTWELVPDLANAIRAKLDEEIGLAIEKLLTTEVQSNLSPFDQAQMVTAQSALLAMGFTVSCQKTMLEYAKRTKVWSFKLN